MSEFDKFDSHLESFGKVRDEDSDFDPFLDSGNKVEDLLSHFKKSGMKSFVLVGESGVGKTAILREFFRNLITEGWRILETSTVELSRGAVYLGEWQTRVTNMAESASVENKIIVYINDIQNLKGAGASSKSDENMADALSTYLQRGEMILVGECTPSGFVKGIESTPSLTKLMTAFQIPGADEEKTSRIVRFVFDELVTDSQWEFELPQVTVSSIVQLGGIYFSSNAQPGAAVNL